MKPIHVRHVESVGQGPRIYLRYYSIATTSSVVVPTLLYTIMTMILFDCICETSSVFHRSTKNVKSPPFSPSNLKLYKPVAPVVQRYHVTSDTLGREFDPGKRDFSH